ncbi:hypothetical protein ACLOJK_025700 [Asimina triloba]
MKNVTWALFASRRALNAITISYKIGFVQAFHRDHRTNNTFYIYSSLANSSVPGTQEASPLALRHGWHERSRHGDAIWYREPLDPMTGEKIGDAKQIPPDDLINIAGLSQLRDGAASWHVAVSKFTDSPLLSAALPVHNPSDGSITAVVGVTTALFSVGQLMKELMEYHSGYMYLTSKEGYVLATSTDSPLLRNSTSGPKLMMPVDSEDRIIRSGAEWLQKAYGNNFSLYNEVHAEDVLLGHRKYYIDSFFLDLKRLPLVGVIIIPRNHELRTPMAAVIGLLDILICDNCLTNEQFATVTQIRKCSTALLRLLNNILDLSKVESGKLVLEEAEFDLVRELEGLVDMFSVQCINHNVETVLDLSDDIPKLVQGDSARVVQIFANLISNSIKFTTYNKDLQYRFLGHEVELTIWTVPTLSVDESPPLRNEFPLWHGGTGLGLCIVRTLVNKMGGEIKVAKKEGPGTLMQLYLVLNAATDGTEQHSLIEFDENNLVVLLALNGMAGRRIMSNWLSKKGVYTMEASEWNELTQILQEVYQRRRTTENSFAKESSTKALRANRIRFFPKEINAQNTRMTNTVIVVDIGLLDLSTDIWREQLNFLDNYNEKAKFAWILNHDTPNAIKIELRRKGHMLMVNKPLYKAKMIQILAAVVSDRQLELQRKNNVSGTQDLHECLEIDHIHLDVASSDDSDTSDTDRGRNVHCNGQEREQRNPPHDRVTNPGKVFESSGTNMSNISQNSNILLRAENEEVVSVDFSSENNGHYTCESTESSEDLQLQSGNSSMKYDHHSVKLSGITLKEEEKLKSEHPFQTAASCHLETLNSKLPRDNGTSVAWKLDTISKAKHSSNQKPEEPACGSSKLNNYQETSIKTNEQDRLSSRNPNPSQTSLDGLCILLAEDTPVLQRVATIMLEKMGATVIAVGDGLQAVEALKYMLTEESRRQNTLQPNGENRTQTEFHEIPRFDLILMDCQMPKMDGYEATKEIRRYEAGTGSHIPIVALTAHAMSSDEAKCLEVGMDAYLTKPIDCKLMVNRFEQIWSRNLKHKHHVLIVCHKEQLYPEWLKLGMIHTLKKPGQCFISVKFKPIKPNSGSVFISVVGVEAV